MSIFNDPILVTLSCCDPFICLQTYAPRHGWSQRFYLLKEAVCKQVSGYAEGSITETDLLNVCTVARHGNNIRFNVLWLHGTDEISGHQQIFHIPSDTVAKAFSGERIKYLAHTPAHMGKADIFLTLEAHRAIAEADKLKRNAIRRFFRDNFDYGRDEHLVVRQDAWVNGFSFFSTVSQYNGGIALHEDKVNGKDGKIYPKYYYGLHT